MPAPSQLAITTQSVTRLLREDISYQRELIEQQGKVTTLESEIKAGRPDEDGNREHMLKQLVCLDSVLLGRVPILVSDSAPQRGHPAELVARERKQVPVSLTYAPTATICV